MREIRDPTGTIWDVIVGKESWGTLVLLFSRRDAAEVRTSILDAESQLDAERELDDMSDDALRGRLAEARPWST